MMVSFAWQSLARASALTPSKVVQSLKDEAVVDEKDGWLVVKPAKPIEMSQVFGGWVGFG